MKLYYWQTPQGNFGDDMNRFLWSHFAPELFDVDDDILFVGIGTILWDTLPKARLRVIMGTGMGYGQFPRDLQNGGWRILAVRGPLTAQAVGRPELAATDPAALLPLLPEFRVERRSGVAFVPHWITAASGRWQEACQMAGVTFVDPRDEAKSVIHRISSSTMVIAESMHGAIVADAFRVPWLPVVSARDTPLKWHDWTLSLGMEYHPIRIANLSNPRRAFSAILGETISSDPATSDDYHKQVQAELAAFLTHGRISRSPAPRGLRSIIKDSASTLIDLATRTALARRAVKTLEALLRRPPMLSAESILANKRVILLQRLETLKEDYAAGRIGSC